MRYFTYLNHSNIVVVTFSLGIKRLLLHLDCTYFHHNLPCTNLITLLSRYWTSNLIVYIARLFHYDLCTVNTLRFTNILFSIGLYFVLLSLILTLSNKRNNWKTQLYALTLCWFPINYFFNFLYYTDPGSTFFVMLSYLLVKKKQYNLAGIIGIVSLTFRQTNVIWITLFMMITIIDTLANINHKKNDEDNSRHLNNPICSSVNTPSKFLMYKLRLFLIITLFH